jgi:hypothetical protein
LTPPAGFAVFYIPPHFREDKATMWNVGIQRELGWNTMAEASYVGTRGEDIFRSYNVNVPMPGAGAVQQRRPYFAIAPTLTTINLRDGDGKSWYDALQLKIDKRFSHGLQILGSYTYSQTEDDIVAVGLHPSLNMRLLSPGTGGSKMLDIPHIFTVSATYELPFTAASPAANLLVKGWAVSSITTFHSGDPLDLRVSASRLNTGTGNWPDVTCSSIGTPKTVTAWFDAACFADPAEFAFGNYRIGQARGPNVFNNDLSAFKKTSIRGKVAEVRIDAFNVFNKAHFANPGTTFGTAQFGRISATRLTPREVQLGVRFLF